MTCRHGGTYKALCTCLKHKLLHHDNGKYDGYRLTNLGYDFLAINTLCKRGAIASVGRQIGVGKESDLFEVCGCADDAHVGFDRQLWRNAGIPSSGLLQILAFRGSEAFSGDCTHEMLCIVARARVAKARWTGPFNN